jgi:hypothetical protein
MIEVQPKPTVEKRKENRCWKRILAKQLLHPDY